MGFQKGAMPSYLALLSERLMVLHTVSSWTESSDVFLPVQFYAGTINPTDFNRITIEEFIINDVFPVLKETTLTDEQIKSILLEAYVGALSIKLTPREKGGSYVYVSSSDGEFSVTFNSHPMHSESQFDGEEHLVDAVTCRKISLLTYLYDSQEVKEDILRLLNYK
jgi:hypothetical protein